MALNAGVQRAVSLAHEIAASRTLWPGWRFHRTPLALHGEVARHLSALAMLPQGQLETAEAVSRYARLILHEAFDVFQSTGLPDPGWTGSRMLRRPRRGGRGDRRGRGPDSAVAPEA